MAQPKVSVSMLHGLGEPFVKMVKRLPTVGTRYIEIVDDGWHVLNKQRVALLVEAANQFDLEYTVHAPFADLNIASPSVPVLKATLKRLTQSIKSAEALDAKLLVLHPGMKTGISNFYPEAEWKQNLASIQMLLKTAKNHGVTVAIENLPGKYWFIMSTPEEFMRFYDETGLEVGIVFDIAHAYLERQVDSFLQKLSDKVVHVHVSDNLGETDNHFGIGYGNIDFSQLAQVLKKNGYGGKVVIESGDHLTESVQKLNDLFV